MPSVAARALPAASVLVLLTGLSPMALAQALRTEGAPRVDPATGRDLLNYPPDLLVDYQHMRLAITIPDMDVPRASAVQELTIEPIDAPVASLRLDARLMAVESVASPGRLVGYTHDGQHLVVTFDPPLRLGEPAKLVTTYTLSDPPRGIVWTPSDPAVPGRPAQLHTQGQSDFNSYWFPIHDFPNDRLTTEIVATVPAGFEVLSNGRLLTRRDVAPGRTEFHWSQDRPHVPYLVSLIVGKFDVVDVAPAGSRVPMPVYVPPGRGGDVARTYGRTPRMLEVFERWLDEPYPWAQYAQATVWNFEAGGMENTGATTMYDAALVSPAAAADRDFDDLIAHELAHQWLGNLITCRSWEHLWLNEGFATYAEAIWLEESSPGDQRGVPRERRAGWTGADAYLASMLDNLDAFADDDRAAAPSQPAMVSKAYAEPDDVFAREANPYPKGAMVLHMLRQRLGDEVFTRAVRTYVDRFRFRQVETGDFRRVLEEVSGESLRRFFVQWCERPGVPIIDAGARWEAAPGGGGTLTVRLRQTQNIDGDNPAFALELPVWILDRGSSAPRQLGVVATRAREAEASFPLGQPPSMLAIDPFLSVAARIRTDVPPAWRVAQLERGPTVVSRILAVRDLARESDDASLAALRRVADDVRELPALRVAAVKALADRLDVEIVDRLAAERGLHRDVALATIEAAGTLAAHAGLAGADRERMARLVVSSASGAPLGRVRRAALEALGRLALPEAETILLQAADTPSDGEQVRRGAIAGLSALGTPRARAALMRLALPGSHTRVREEAIRALPRVSRGERSEAIALLQGLLNDRTHGVWTAAGEALVELGDPAAQDALAALSLRKRDPRQRDMIDRWLTALRPGAAAGDVAAASDPAIAPVGQAESWASAPAHRAALADDPVAFFAARGAAVELRDGRLFMRTEPGLSIGGPGDPLPVAGAALVRAADRVRAITLTLAPPAAERVREFSRSLVGRRLAVLVDGQVRGTLTLVAPLSGTVQIAADLDPAQATRLRDAALALGALQLRVLAKPPPGLETRPEASPTGNSSGVSAAPQPVGAAAQP